MALSWRATFVAWAMVWVQSLGVTNAARAQVGAFQMEIRRPEGNLVVPYGQRSIALQGRASNFGAVEPLDLLLVMDTSKSLLRTDPNDHRAAGALGLVRFLFWSDARIGVVDFDRKARLLLPLTADRTAVINVIGTLDQKGFTSHVEGIRTALGAFEQGARPGATRAMLVFTDGMKKSRALSRVVTRARERGIAIYTVLLGSGKKSAAIMREIGRQTGGGFVAVKDPAALPDAFLSLRSTGVRRVSVRVNDGPAIDAVLSGALFSLNVPLEPGDNRIVATALGSDGRTRADTLEVTVRPPGCGELIVRAEHSGRPALSISNRAVEIVVDASGSMWGRMEERTKIEIAREILDDALDWLPAEMNLSLRAYGHRSDPKENNCEDSELLVGLDPGNRGEIRAAIESLQPRGQTPLGYSLGQVAADLAAFEGERAVVLVTDGIESCGGDASAQARALAQIGVVVHVIGFGIDGRNGADLASLRAIAEASGGRFITASSAAQLRQALSTTVGTAYRVEQGGESVAQGILGDEEPIRLPAGEYTLELESTPHHSVSVALASEENLSLVLRRAEDGVVEHVTRSEIEFAACELPADATFLPAASPARIDDARPQASQSMIDE